MLRQQAEAAARRCAVLKWLARATLREDKARDAARTVEELQAARNSPGHVLRRAHQAVRLACDATRQPRTLVVHDAAGRPVFGKGVAGAMAAAFVAQDAGLPPADPARAGLVAPPPPGPGPVQGQPSSSAGGGRRLP